MMYVPPALQPLCQEKIINYDKYEHRKRVLVTGGAGFIGSHLCERLLARGTRCSASTISSPAGADNIAHLLADPRFELMRHDVTFPLYRRGRPDLQSGLPGLAGALPVRPGADDQDQRARRHQHAGPGQAGAGEDPPGHRPREVYGDPQVHPQTRGLLGQRQPDRARAPATTRASAAPRPCSSTITASTGCRSRSRGSSTPTARACTPTTAAWSPTSSSRRCRASHHHLRRRHPDALVLLRRRPGRGLDPADGRRPDEVTGPINLGNPVEFTIRQLAEKVLAADRLALEDRARAAAGRTIPMQRRPDITQGARTAGLGADHLLAPGA